MPAFSGDVALKTHILASQGSFFGLFFLHLSINMETEGYKSSQGNFNHDSHTYKAGYNINMAWLPMTLARPSFVTANGILSSFWVALCLSLVNMYRMMLSTHVSISPLDCFRIVSWNQCSHEVGVHVFFSSTASSQRQAQR